MPNRPKDRQNGEDDLERKMVETLEFGRMEREDPERGALERLSPRYVVRIKAEQDPILEETEQYRGMAEEVDDRYDAYVNAACRSDRNGDADGK